MSTTKDKSQGPYTVQPHSAQSLKMFPSVKGPAYEETLFYSEEEANDLADALNAAYQAGQADRDKIDKPGEGDPDAHLSDEAYLKAKQERFAKGGLANVDPDKYMEEVRGTGMVLTEQWVNACIGALERALHPVVIHGATTDTEDVRHAITTLRYARDNGYLSAPAKAPAEVAPSPQAVTVEGIMEVVDSWRKNDSRSAMEQSEERVAMENYSTGEWVFLPDLRTRLDQYLNSR